MYSHIEIFILILLFLMHLNEIRLLRNLTVVSMALIGDFGCMTMRNTKSGVLYTSSILANNISVGLGIASTLDASGICWIQTGDGAIEEGAFMRLSYLLLQETWRSLSFGEQ